MAAIDTLKTLQAQDARIRTLEDALRPFAEKHTSTTRYGGGGEFCITCWGVPAWPCKYETARRALEGE